MRGHAKHLALTLLVLTASPCLVRAQDDAVAEAEVALRRGRIDEALALIESAPDSAPIARLLNDCALALADRGRVERAWERHDQAVRMWERLTNLPPATRAAGASRLAGFLKAQGRFASALPRYEEAVALGRRLAGESAQLAESLIALGYCVAALGRPQEGLDRAEEGLALGRRVLERDHPTIARGLRVAGVCLSALNREEEAVTRYRAALGMLRRLHEGDHVDTAMVLHNLGFSLIRLKIVEPAAEMLQRAFAMDLRIFGPDHIQVALDWNSRGVFLWGQDGPREAEPCFRRALEIARAQRHPHAHVFATNVGICLDREGRRAEALPFYEEAIAEIETLDWRARGLAQDERRIHSAHLRRGRPYHRLAAIHLDGGRATDAVRWLERGRAGGVLDILARSRFDALAEAARRAREQDDTTTLKRIESLTRDLGSTNAEERRRARRERAQVTRDLVPLGNPAAPHLLQRLLGRNERLLIYSLAPRDEQIEHFFLRKGTEDEGGPSVPGVVPARPEAKRSFVVIVPPPGEPIRWLPLRWPDGHPASAEGIAAAVDRHLTAMARDRGKTRGLAVPKTKGTRGTSREGVRLFEALVPSKLRGIQRVYIVPDGALHQLPFETLVVDKRKGTVWLDRGPEIAYTPSGSTLLWCARRRDEQRTRKQRHGVVALGGCNFAGTLPPLPGTRREVLAIEKALGKERAPALLLGEKATERALFDVAPQARILHLATHQLIEETEAGSTSRLALTPTPGNDGYLTLHEMFDRWRDRLSGCELVVLSACETLKGPAPTDDAPFAMPLGFLYAGAPAVIGSLWRVDDASAADLFSDFYRRLHGQGGKDKLKAFTEARRALRKKHPEPYHWAPFIYIGDPR